jgi:hypothetical protein
MENLSVHPIDAACKSGIELSFRSLYAFFPTFEKLNVVGNLSWFLNSETGIFIFYYLIQMRAAKRQS